MRLIVKTPADLATAIKAAEARSYLAETDWLAIRAAETGKPVPLAVAQARAEARRTLGEG